MDKIQVMGDFITLVFQCYQYFLFVIVNLFYFTDVIKYGFGLKINNGI